MLKYIFLLSRKVFEIANVLKHVYILYKMLLSSRLTKDWELMMDQLSHVSLVQYWQMFYLFLNFSLREKCPNMDIFLVCIFLH